MDTNENIFPDEEVFAGSSAQPEEPVSETQSYYTEPVKEKRSPFAESPYEMNFEQTNTYRYVSPEIPKKKKSGGKLWKGIGAAVLAVALVAGSCGITAAVMNAKMEEQAKALTDSFNQKLENILVDISHQVTIVPSAVPMADGTYTPAQVYEMCKRSVVGITNEYTATTGSMYPFGGGTSTAVATGSGFVLTDTGYIVTNYHVVEDADKLTVTLYDGSEYEAEMIGGDADCDIALLKIEAEGLYPVTVGDSNSLLIGDQVVAIGNPLGELTATQTVGYISGKDREVSTDGTVMNMLQTDAAINSGNSGGPLFNMYGQVVGITTAKYSGTSNSGASIEGIGFAIPISDVIGMFEDIKELGYVTGAYLGVMVKDMDSSTASLYNLPVGAYVESVTEGSCAANGGMRAKDIIIELGGYKVDSRDDLSLALRKFKAGDQVTAVVFRGGAEVTLTLVLDEKPQETQSEPAADPSMPSEGNFDDWYEFFAPYFGNGMG